MELKCKLLLAFTTVTSEENRLRNLSTSQGKPLKHKLPGVKSKPKINKQHIFNQSHDIQNKFTKNKIQTIPKRNKYTTAASLH